MNSTVFGVGIDTARYGHHVSFVDQDARTAANGYLFKEDMAGYEKLKKSLLALVKKCPDAKIRVCIDPAGIYGNNLTQFLQKLEIPNMTVFVAHPERSKEYRKAVVGNKKADASDSLSCARFAVKENPPASPVVSTEMDSLRRCVSAIESLATERTMLINQLHSLLASVFPEFAIYASDIGASYCLKLLEKYPSGKRIASARLDSILSIPHMKEELAKAIHAAAKNSVARNCDEIIETLVTQKIKQIQNADMQQQLLDKTLKKAWDSLPEAPCKQLLTICGIGLQTAASIVAKVVDIKRFESPSKLIGYFGVYPTLYESGTTKEGSAKRSSPYGMARQGNDLVRRNLYMAAQTAAQHNPAVKALYARQRQLGKEHGVALGHCMTKLLRIAYALWVKDESFDPNFEARQSATKQEEENVVGPNLKEVKPQKQEVTTTSSSLIEPEPSSRRKPLNYVILKACLNIEDILAKHRWKQRSSRGAQTRGRCLICKHQDENAFAANRTKNVYCCHRCGSKGNALDLLSELSKQPLHDAAWDWIDREGITPPLL